MSPLLTLALTASIAAPAPSAMTRPDSLTAQALSIAATLPPPAGAGGTAWRDGAAQPPGGDSLKNGAVKGAIAGGLAAGALVGVLCYLYDDGDDRLGDCIRATALWTGIGAAGGAALGAGVDALFTHGPRARATGIPPGPSARVQLRVGRTW